MKILFPTPVTWDGNDDRYLQRDGARFAQWFAARGHEAVKIIYDRGKVPGTPVSPLLALGTPSQWQDPEYWKTFHADAALLYGGMRRSMLPVARALKDAGLRVWLKMDSHLGLFDFPQYFLTEVRRNYSLARVTRGPWPGAWRALYSTLRHSVSRSGFVKEYYETFDKITFETPLSLTNTEAWLRRHDAERFLPKLELLPHPAPDSFACTSAIPKENLLFACCLDWTNYNKGGRLLGPALGRFLVGHPDYTAVVAGGSGEQVKTLAETVAGRPLPIETPGKMPSAELAPYYQRAKIFVLSSGSESQSNVVSEALCAGCSIVCSPNLPQIQSVFGRDAGTTATSHTVRGFVLAMDAEAEAWAAGKRNPAAISERVGAIYLVTPCSEKLLEWCKA